MDKVQRNVNLKLQAAVINEGKGRLPATVEGVEGGTRGTLCVKKYRITSPKESHKINLFSDCYPE